MRELLIDTRETEDLRGASRKYTYSILVDEMNVGAFSCESYGVKITERETGHTAMVSHVTTSIPRIDELVELLIRNQVTPTSLRDVIDDWL